MFDNGSKKDTSSTKNYGSELIEILIDRLEAEKQEFSKNQYSLYITFSMI